MLRFESGLTVAEIPQNRLAHLHEKTSNEYKELLTNFNPVSDENLEIFSCQSYSFTVRDNLIEDFKTLVRSESDDCGKKIWDG